MTDFEYSAGAFIYRMDGELPVFLFLIKPGKEYDIPKGHLEKGETAEIAAKREIKEEAGVDAEFVPFFEATTKYFFRKGKKRIAKQVRYFLSQVGSVTVKISQEHIGYDWLSYDDAVKKLKFKNQIDMLTRVNEYIKKLAKMAKINHRYAQLPLQSGHWDLSRTLVPGEGLLDGRLMLIGQAPGADEDELLRPFIGRSGQLLSRLLEEAGISRKKLYITSTVQFFPPKNRIPSPEEVELCLPFLKEQIEVVDPRYIILLGSVSTLALTGVVGAEKNHGRIIVQGERTYMITLHPAAVLRIKSKTDMMKEDLRAFKRLMDGQRHAR